jgi:cardiolipin synthase A/B
MPQYQDGHQLQLLEGSREFFPTLVAAIDAAQHEVRMETYIFDFTASGEQVAQALIRSAQRGVLTYLTVDGVGTPELPEQWLLAFSAAGVQCQVYAPLGKLGLLIPSRWRRLHRKLVVIDEQLAFCGGINVLDDFYDPNYGTLEKPRFDFSVCVQGPLVKTTQAAMQQLWRRYQAWQLARGRSFQAAYHAMRESSPRWLSLQSTIKSIAARADKSTAAIVLRDNFQNRGRIERAYRLAIAQAQHEIIIANAYFLPGGKLRRALVAAAKRGVRVRLLLQGKYEYFMQYHAARPVYGTLLAAGVEIHEYAASFLHAKVAVVDADTPHAWATVGSSNLDPLSLLLAREANVMVRDSAFAKQLRDRLLRAIEKDGQTVSPDDYAKRPLLLRLTNWLAYGLMRLALAISGMRY